MSGLVEIKVTGLDSLQAQLLDLGAELGAKLLAQAVRKAFAPVFEAARGLVPVDSGELRDSIKLTVVKPGSSDTVVAVGLRIGKASAAKAGSMSPARGFQRGDGRHFPAARRWHWIEFGTAHMAAHPFLRNALDANAGAVLDLLKEELAKSIQRAVRKRAKAGG